MKLAILIPARNEIFLEKTLEDLYAHLSDETEVLVGLDGWNTVITPRKNLRVIHREVSIGQRAMTNELARLTDATYLMKLDAHLSFSPNFDAEMLAIMEDDMTLIPLLYNLHAYDWVCLSCQKRIYQGVRPATCECGSPNLYMDVVWRIKGGQLYSNFYFDSNLIFQNDIPPLPLLTHEIMCIQGCGFMVHRDKYWELNLSDEEFGSWGQQGVEIACKTWLSGGRCLLTKKAFMGHLFRKHEEFPYQRDMNQVEHAYNHSKKLFLEGTWPLAKHDIGWLVRKFDFPGDWTEERVLQLSNVITNTTGVL